MNRNIVILKKFYEFLVGFDRIYPIRRLKFELETGSNFNLRSLRGHRSLTKHSYDILVKSHS